MTVVSDVASVTSSKGLLRAIQTLGYRYGLILVWGGMAGVFTVLRPETFATTTNMKTILGTQVVLVVSTLGLLITLIIGSYDLSISANVVFVSVTVAVLNVNYGWPLAWAVITALAAGAVVGFANGLLVVVLGVSDVIVTIGMATLLIGASTGFTNYIEVGGVSQGLTNAVRQPLLSLPFGFYYGLGMAFLLWYVFRFTPFGRYLLVIGRGQDAARRVGLSVDRIRITAFVLTGFIAAIAGILLTGLRGTADPQIAGDFLLPAFSAAFLGSTVVTPGFFNVWGTLVAVYFLVTVVTGLQLVGMSSWIEQVFYGLALAVAVTLSRVAERRRHLTHAMV